MEPSLIISILSGILLVIGIFLWQKGQYLMLNGKKTVGTAFDHVENFSAKKKNGFRRIVYYPIVQFTTEDDRTFSYEFKVGSSYQTPIGTEYNIIYDPENPEKSSIDSTLQLEILPRILVSAGGIGFVLGLLTYLDVIAIF